MIGRNPLWASQQSSTDELQTSRTRKLHSGGNQTWNLRALRGHSQRCFTQIYRSHTQTSWCCLKAGDVSKIKPTWGDSCVSLPDHTWLANTVISQSGGWSPAAQLSRTLGGLKWLRTHFLCQAMRSDMNSLFYKCSAAGFRCSPPNLCLPFFCHPFIFNLNPSSSYLWLHLFNRVCARAGNDGQETLPKAYQDRNTDLRADLNRLYRNLMLLQMVAP